MSKLKQSIQGIRLSVCDFKKMLQLKMAQWNDGIFVRGETYRIKTIRVIVLFRIFNSIETLFKCVKLFDVAFNSEFVNKQKQIRHGIFMAFSVYIQA